MVLSQTARQPMARWLSIVGARPQFIKVAPLSRAIENHNASGSGPHIQHRIIHTGQHYDYEVAEVFFEQMKIPRPNYDLGVGSGSHGAQLARMLERLEPILAEESPDWVLVYGDTNSTLAGALIAARLKFPLAHVEAGCRSHDKEPEEQNRVITDHLSQLLLAPCEHAMANLRREGIGQDDDASRRAVNVGDILYDALQENLRIADERAAQYLRTFELTSKKYYLLTIHRAENTDDPSRLRTILEAASSLGYPVLFPVHPRTQSALRRAGISLTNDGGERQRDMIRQAPPFGYLEMLAMEKHARKILTDSGGVQKEAFYLHVPCVTLRDRTEWPETVRAGANIIAGTTPDSIISASTSFNGHDWSSESPFGKANSAARIVDELLAGVAECQLETAQAV